MFSKSGEVRWLDVVGSVLGGSDVLVVLRDVTEKVELERKLKESERRYRTLVENSLATVFVIQDDRIVYNPEFERFTGYSREEWERQNAFVCFDKVGIGKAAREVARRVLRGETIRTVAKYATKSGEVRYAEFVLTPIDLQADQLCSEMPST